LYFREKLIQDFVLGGKNALGKVNLGKGNLGLCWLGKVHGGKKFRDFVVGGKNAVGKVHSGKVKMGKTRGALLSFTFYEKPSQGWLKLNNTNRESNHLYCSDRLNYKSLALTGRQSSTTIHCILNAKISFAKKILGLWKSTLSNFFL